MITVLWVMTVGSIIAVAASLSGRTTFNGARNRVQSERALWTALGCARHMQAMIDDLLHGAPTLDGSALIWRTLDRQTRAAAPPIDSACRVELEAAGTKLDVNAASGEMLTTLLRGLGESDGSAMALAAALEDWRDTDNVAVPAGAERDWYHAAQRVEPRNAPLADIRELGLVRGFEDLSRFDSVLTTEPGRVSLATAPITVLLAVPGFTRETAELIATLHDAGTPLRDPASIIGQLSTESVDAMIAHYPEITRLTTADPDAWIVTTSVSNGVPATTDVLRWRLARAGRRCVVVRTVTLI